jgi:hypothetical protein
MTHRHLNDEQLSAHLDGERPEGLSGAPEDALETEIAACDPCRLRLAQLAEARALVRTPVVPVAPSMRAAAVEAAIADGLGDGAGSGPGPDVVTLASRRPRGRLLSGAAAAVAVLAVVAAVSVAVAHGGPSSTPSAASAVRRGVAGHGAAKSSAQTPSASSTSSTATAVASLGSVSSPEVLRQRLAPDLAAAANQQDSISGTTATGATENQAQKNVSAVPSSGYADSKPAQGTAISCAATALRAAGADDTLVLVATATYRDTAALVVVAQGAKTSSTASQGRVAIVVAQSGCRVLARTAL